ncbi:hypothetical protein QWY14_07890 [Planococcus sp. N028]|uniref:Uncharacterized protein n=1 Tax=Planococcus shixiaomingii TaxID=3058393 RepID=A0ABT8N1E0_9BACL|nr:hypothetical protein [Planococcus sp. N028]MDN7241711.1 hypothetical protein [Planococcus sp. N028]
MKNIELKKSVQVESLSPKKDYPTIILFFLLLTSSFLYMWIPRIYAFGNIKYYLYKNLSTGSSEMSDLLTEFPMYLKFLNPFIYLVLILTIIYVIAKYKIIKNNYLIIYLWIIFYMCFLLAFKSTDPLIYLTSLSKASSILAPGTILMIFLFFLSYNPAVWNQIIVSLKLFVYIVLLCCLIGFFGIYYEYSSNGLIHRLVSLRWVWTPSLILELICIILLATNIKNKKNIFLFVPIIFLYLGGLLTQTRLTIIIGTINIFIFLYLTKKLRFSLSLFKRITLVIVVFCTCLFLYAVFAKTEFLDLYLEQFISRVFEDTRSEQASNFFFIFSSNINDIFPFGSGYPAENEYRAIGETGIDSGYLNILFTTGIPMFLLVGLLLIIPVIKALRINLSFSDAAIVAAAFTWILRLTSSSTMMFTTEFLLFVLFSGRCAWLVNNAKKGKSI